MEAAERCDEGRERLADAGLLSAEGRWSKGGRLSEDGRGAKVVRFSGVWARKAASVERSVEGVREDRWVAGLVVSAARYAVRDGGVESEEVAGGFLRIAARRVRTAVGRTLRSWPSGRNDS